MGSCNSTEVDKEAKMASKKIDDQLKKEADTPHTVMKILLLGPGESGKSTVLKQMRIIHLDGFTHQELINRKAAVFVNVVESMGMLLKGMHQLQYILSPDRLHDAEIVERVLTTNRDNLSMSKELSEAIGRLWDDKMAKEAFTLRSQFQINDSAPYFFDSIVRISSEDYVPSVQDVLMTRIATIGVQEISYVYKKIFFRIFDVGGQKSERRKWIHCFDNVNAILFIVAISEYDQLMREDNETNRMIDSMSLFKDIINSVFFVKAQVILFLNKKDLFMEKIKTIPLVQYFPKYKGGESYEEGTSYFKKCFEKLKKDKEKTLYSHFTCATDTDQVQIVLNNATDMIISENFKQTGVM